jgi:selenocysteine lyase/cysteine desulfurase
VAGNRRDFLKLAAGGVVLPSAVTEVMVAQAAPEGSAHETEFTQWYDVDRSLTNLENAYWNVMARPVMDEYWRQTQYLNRVNVPFVRSVTADRTLAADLDKVRSDVASLVGVEKDEIALTRCGTESLQDLIIGYRLLKPGDEIVFCDIDYDAMVNTMLYLEDRRGVKVSTFEMPEPATTGAILDAYETKLKNTPKARLMLVTHLCHKTGLVNPVKEIIAIARRHGVAVILDTAQAVGQVPVNLREIEADFAGFSLHKWIGAPLGVGAIYVRKARLGDLELCMGNREDSPDDVRSRVYPGTYNFAATLTIPAAIAFHSRLTVEKKQARLTGLRDRWVHQAMEIDGIQILTPEEKGRYGATTSFRVKGMKSFEQAKQMQETLLKKYGIVTVARKGIARGAAVRVTPALYNTDGEVDKLVAALKVESRMFA